MSNMKLIGSANDCPISASNLMLIVYSNSEKRGLQTKNEAAITCWISQPVQHPAQKYIWGWTQAELETPTPTFCPPFQKFLWVKEVRTLASILNATRL